MSFFFERNAELYVSNVITGWSSGNTDKIPLRKGFTYKINSVVDQAYRNTIKASQSRAVRPYSAKEPLIDFTFTTYINSYTDAPNVTCSERYLWQALTESSGFTPGASYLELDFTNTNTQSAKEFTIWVAFSDGNIYRFDNCIIQTASIEAVISDIASITWTGSAQSITNLGLASGNTPSHTIQTFDNCVINKLSTISLDFNSKSFSIPLTDFELQIANNVNFVYRQKLAQISSIVGQYTGARAITGSITGYLKIGTNKMAELLDDLLTLKNSLEDNLATLTINLGNSSGTHVTFIMSNTVLDLPEQDFASVISLRIPFIATESTTGAADEATIRYYI